MTTANQLNVFVTRTFTETRTCTGIPDEATRKAWLAEGFEFKYGRWTRRDHKADYISVSQLAAKQAA